MHPDSWRPSSPRSMAPNQYNNFGSDNPLALSGGAVTSADAVCLCQSFVIVLLFVSSFPNLFPLKHGRLLSGHRCSLETAPYQL